MTSPLTSRYYKVSGEALELVRAYKTEVDALVTDRIALEKEFAQRAKEQGEYHQSNLRTLWRRMAASVGLDPETTWGRPEFQVETRYLEDDFGAILYTPMNADPLRNLLSGDAASQLPDPTTDIPSKGTKVH